LVVGIVIAFAIGSKFQVILIEPVECQYLLGQIKILAKKITRNQHCNSNRKVKDYQRMQGHCRKKAMGFLLSKP
jgi:hypothetical protein